MSESTKPSDEQVVAEGDAMIEAVTAALSKYRPQDISVDALKKRTMMAGASLPATRTNLLALAAFLGLTAYTTTLTKEQLVGVISDVYDKVSSLPLMQKAQQQYAVKTAERAAAAAAKAQSADAFMAAGTETIN